MIHIIYTQYFQDFLDTFDLQKQELIKKIITDYCDGAILLPRPEKSKLNPQIQKVAIHDADIVIFYVEVDGTWIILTGIEIPKRAA